MAINVKNLRRKHVETPPRILLYGGDGLGKTTFGMKAPNPVFIQTEKSTLIYKDENDTKVEIPTLGVVTTFDEMMEGIQSLYQDEHEFKTVVLDSADHLTPIIHAETAKRNGWKNVEDIDFQKGYMAAVPVWKEVIDGFEALNDDRDMAVIWLGHVMMEKYKAPDVEPYDRFTPKLHKFINDYVRERMDAVFFTNFKTSVVKTDMGFKKTAVRGVGSTDRFMFTTQRPPYMAKNRYKLPESFEMDEVTSGWDVLMQHIDYYRERYIDQQPVAPIAAAVTE